MSMTRASVRDLVNALVDFDAETYITSDPDLNALINERLDAYAIASRAFLVRETANVAAVVANGPYSVDMRTFGNYGLTSPTDVWVNGNQLVDLTGRPGPCSTQALADRYTNYLTTVPGTVRHWASMGADKIEIYPAPAAIASVAIIGTGLHGALADDAAVTRWPSELDRPFCYDVAAQLLLPRASGDTLTRANGFATLANAAAVAYATKSVLAEGGRKVRGLKRGERRVARIGQ